jgi:hypothetical protein
MEISGEGRAKEMETTHELFRGCLFEGGEVGVLVEWDLETVVFCKRLGGMRGWAERSHARRKVLSRGEWGQELE